MVWDKPASDTNLGAGLHVLVDGKPAAKSLTLSRLTLRVEQKKEPLESASPATTATNFAVNNDGDYYPRLTASYVSPTTSASKLNDGNYWYLPHPPNRWTCEGSPNEQDSVIIDFGTPRTLHTVKLYPLDDSDLGDSTVRAPQRIELDAWIDNTWRSIKSPDSVLGSPAGHRANVVKFDPLETTKLRVTLHHAAEGKSGLTEIEAWGDVQLPLESVAPPAGNLAWNPKPDGYPKASASYSDRFGGKPASAIDGRTVFLPTPMNRWTSYESKSETDWLEIDFGRDVEFRRIELAIYDDRGGVQPPTAYVIQHWTGTEWHDVQNPKNSPAQPLGSQWNEARFEPVTSAKVRIVFTHRGQSRSGVSEVLIWND